MKFSVIYEAECGMHQSIRTLLPTNRKLWQTTEQSDGEPSDWCSDLWDGKCKHRKLCGILTREQFDRFISDAMISTSMPLIDRYL